MELAVSLYSYASVLENGKYSFEDCLRHAREQGYTAVEVLDLDTYPMSVIKQAKGLSAADEDKNKKAQIINDCLKAEGIRPICYSISSSFSELPLELFPHETQRLEKEIAVANEMGCPYIRIDLFSHPHPQLSTPQEHREVLQPILQRLLAVAKQHNIGLLVENHGTMYNSVDRLIPLLEENPGLGCLCDIGNFVEAHSALPQDIMGLAPWIKHVHIKDFHCKDGQSLFPGEGWYDALDGSYIRGAVLGHGDLKLIEFIKFLVNIGYSSALCLEFEGIEYAPYAIELSADYLKRALDFLPQFTYPSRRSETC